MHVIPLVTVSVAERQMRIEVARQIVQVLDVRQGHAVGGGDLRQPQRILVRDREELGANLGYRGLEGGIRYRQCVRTADDLSEEAEEVAQVSARELANVIELLAVVAEQLAPVS